MYFDPEPQAQRPTRSCTTKGDKATQPKTRSYAAKPKPQKEKRTKSPPKVNAKKPRVSESGIQRELREHTDEVRRMLQESVKEVTSALAAHGSSSSSSSSSAATPPPVGAPSTPVVAPVTMPGVPHPMVYPQQVQPTMMLPPPMVAQQPLMIPQTMWPQRLW
eukprot:TRINITY_DN66188_c0_g1_i2.p2 TRINITY_DN66188_c0_g1~~TRINITY_DN66188_c0_g1_i2.p2  ORF type:complete len:162 (+),score=22.65 TRINITY_DN66188_c0_g1_i2:1206-1691(+)